MRVVFALFLLVCMASCDPPYQEENPYLPTKQSLVNEVMNQTFVKMKMEKGLIPCGIGSGMMHQIRMLALAFDYYKEIDIDEARELLIAAGSEFLKTINSNEKIRIFLDQYPFTPKNIEISIFLRNPDGSLTEPGKLTVASIINGILKYNIRSLATGQLEIVYKESYEEAIQKVRIKQEDQKRNEHPLKTGSSI